MRPRGLERSSPIAARPPASDLPVADQSTRDEPGTDISEKAPAGDASRLGAEHLAAEHLAAEPPAAEPRRLGDRITDGRRGGPGVRAETTIPSTSARMPQNPPPDLPRTPSPAASAPPAAAAAAAPVAGADSAGPAGPPPSFAPAERPAAPPRPGGTTETAGPPLPTRTRPAPAPAPAPEPLPAGQPATGRQASPRPPARPPVPPPGEDRARPASGARHGRHSGRVTGGAALPGVDSGEHHVGNRHPGGRPGGERPGGERPTSERPGSERPTSERPTSERPGGERQVGDRPGGERHSRPGRVWSLRASADRVAPGMVRAAIGVAGNLGGRATATGGRNAGTGASRVERPAVTQAATSTTGGAAPAAPVARSTRPAGPPVTSTAPATGGGLSSSPGAASGRALPAVSRPSDSPLSEQAGRAGSVTTLEPAARRGDSAGRPTAPVRSRAGAGAAGQRSDGSAHPAPSAASDGPRGDAGLPESARVDGADDGATSGRAGGLAERVGGRPVQVGLRVLVACLVAAALVGGVVSGLLVVITTGDPNVEPVKTLGVGNPAPVTDRRSVAAIAAAMLPTVVTIDVGGDAADGGDTGSGVILSSDGYILTNNHVIAPAIAAGSPITVTRYQEFNRIQAQVVGRDPQTDLAVLRVPASTPLPAATLGQSGSLVVGAPVVAIGAPLGLSGTVTTGVVSALDRNPPVPATDGAAPTVLIGAIQVDAALNPGNSGGPLLDSLGQVVGINAAIAAVPGREDQGQSGSIGVGFAIPIDFARSVAQEIISTGRATHPYVGAATATITDGEAQASDGVPGARVIAVTPDGPAARAGLRANDVITKLDVSAIRGTNDLNVAARLHRVGDRISVTYVRGGATRTTQLTLQEQPG
ncbi:trypsin-like peptidase domain-containing protein [Frankia sp. Ag45/Mut15]|uniref:Trypsin-like peptidase domain-containing protein n=2 Tax=Frankia umida TaxID=573489 RepID=A0ABT0JVY7_9ACTN|nr:trypsin-like peptidase domain-containing protein [Frankia umida]